MMSQQTKIRFIITCFALTVVLLSTFYGLNAHATDDKANINREYHLKAAFLRYVAQYVTFPEETMQDGFINLCVVGDIPGMKGINSVNGRIVNERSVVVKVLPRAGLAESAMCQIVYVGDVDPIEPQSVVDLFRTKPILTFGDQDGFAELGGGMNFYESNNRLAIMINLAALHESKLSVSPRMLRLVSIVPSASDLADSPSP